MNKQDIISNVIEMLGGDLAEVEANIGNLHATANNAPGAMESWSDSTRRERQSMASDMEVTKTALHNAILFLKNLQPGDSFLRIAPGSLIETEQDGAAQWYFMVPFGGGKNIVSSETTVKTITPDSKIGSALQGGKPGDSIAVSLPAGEKHISIVNIS